MLAFFISTLGLAALNSVTTAAPTAASLLPPDVLAPRDVGLLNIACNVGRSAKAPDAVFCIDYLASLGSTPCVAEPGAPTTFCSEGNATVAAISHWAEGTESTCQDVARALGAIMDSCYRSDDTVQGSGFAWGNANMTVYINGTIA